MAFDANALTEIRSIRNPAERLAALADFIDLAEQAAHEAREVRDGTIRSMTRDGIPAGEIAAAARTTTRIVEAVLRIR